MNDPFAFGVLLTKSLPEEVLRFLTRYIQEVGDGDRYLFSSVFEIRHPFVELEILRNDGTDYQWKVKLPLQYVLAVADGTDPQTRLKMGFSR